MTSLKKKNGEFHVLIAEDDISYARVGKMKLMHEGYDVAVAKNGEIALSLMREHKPDLLLLDLIMPIKDGFETLQEMKIDPTLSSVPVVVLTNLGQDSDKQKAFELGAKEYLIKSNISIYELLDLVRKYSDQKH